jgi:hypothetical protein
MTQEKSTNKELKTFLLNAVSRLGQLKNELRLATEAYMLSYGSKDVSRESILWRLNSSLDQIESEVPKILGELTKLTNDGGTIGTPCSRKNNEEEKKEIP